MKVILDNKNGFYGIPLKIKSSNYCFQHYQTKYVISFVSLLHLGQEWLFFYQLGTFACNFVTRHLLSL